MAGAADIIDQFDPNEEWVFELRTHLAAAWTAIKELGSAR
jgi:hypothetical protein